MLHSVCKLCAKDSMDIGHSQHKQLCRKRWSLIQSVKIPATVHDQLQKSYLKQFHDCGKDLVAYM